MAIHKLIIKETCVAARGKIVERGSEYTAGTEEEQYQLIASGRAVTEKDPEAEEILEQVAAEREVAATPETPAPTPAPVVKKTLADTISNTKK